MNPRNKFNFILIVILIILYFVIYKYYLATIAIDNGGEHEESATRQSQPIAARSEKTGKTTHTQTNPDKTKISQGASDTAELYETHENIFAKDKGGLKTTQGYYKKTLNNEWVVVDCEKRKILKCPHALIENQTTPLTYEKGTTHFLYGKCKDVTVDTRSFCGF